MVTGFLALKWGFRSTGDTASSGCRQQTQWVVAATPWPSSSHAVTTQLRVQNAAWLASIWHASSAALQLIVYINVVNSICSPLTRGSCAAHQQQHAAHSPA